MSPDPGISIDAARHEDMPLLSNLLELYMHDMSEIFPLRLDGAGRFGYERLPLYATQPDSHLAFLIRHKAEIVGFALVTRGSPASADPEALDMAEFFVTRSQRRHGTGRAAAVQICTRLPGHWVIRVAQKNPAALSFWRATIAGFAPAGCTEKDHPGKTHTFRVFEFTNAPRSRSSA